MSLAVGCAATLFAVFCFGSCFVPVRRFATGDGFFAQWIMCLGIFLVGCLVEASTGYPPLQPAAAIGGAIWAVGNATALPLMQRLGMAVAVLLWSSVMVVVGWATGRFGLLGMTPRPPLNSLCNYIGLGLVVVGAAFSAFIRPTPTVERDESEKDGQPSKDVESASTERIRELSRDDGEKRSTSDGVLGQLLWMGIAMFSGLCYGLVFVPAIYMQDNHPEAPREMIAYVFSHYLGIVLASTAIFAVYAAFKKNRPWVSSQLILPALLSGIMWGTAMVAFFIAVQHLSQTITYPIIGMGPGCVIAIWSVYYFKDITGQRNYRLLVAALVVTALGSIFTTLSKADIW